MFNDISNDIFKKKRKLILETRMRSIRKSIFRKEKD